MLTRRTLLRTAAAGAIVGSGGYGLARWLAAGPAHIDPVSSADLFYALPGKRPLIKRSLRPPNLETPVSVFNDLLTPNDAFYVRYHLADIPALNVAGWRLAVGGTAIARPMALGWEALQRDFEHVEVVAVNQCSGNRRGLFEPRVPGLQWESGAMGNARWRGVRLRDVLLRAGLKPDAVELTFEGADRPVLAQTPDFVKSLPVAKAMDQDTLIAFEMNGESFPHWHGYPARLVVPGWTATYWVKHLVSIEAVNQGFQGFWMKTAYRVPRGAFPAVQGWVAAEPSETVPITGMVINSLITNVKNDDEFRVATPIEVKGVAWDSGHGIHQVEVSTDGGNSWRLAELGADLGRYAWRPWRYRYTPDGKGRHALLAKASNRNGETQGFASVANPAGYHHNSVQRVEIHVV